MDSHAPALMFKKGCGGFLLPALVFALWGCGSSDPLVMQVAKTAVLKPAKAGEAPLVSLVVELENRGKMAVHVEYDKIQVLTDADERQALRAFRQEIRRMEQEAPTPAAWEAMIKPLAPLGVDRLVVEDLKQHVIEIIPGERVQKVFPFRLSRVPARLTLDVEYHDVATDKMLHVRREVVVKG